jgi:hypothetical protein
MATSGLYGSSPTGGLVAEPGAESSGLYGNSTNFGGTYFQWFIFQESATAPATPTGGSWNFLTNTGTAPAGWTTAPPVNPTNTVWFSISIVNSRNTAALVWTAPAPLVEQGPPGTAATVNAGTTTTGAAGTSASVTNVGTTSAAVFNFVIPRGDTGATGSTGSAATVAAGTTTTGAAGSSATVVNSGTSSAAVFDFTIPRGDTGATGATGATGTAATIAAGTTTTGAAGTSATVTNVGTSSAAIFDFSIPQGAGVITGGTTGQFLAKASNANYDTTWLSITGNLNYQGSWNASTNTPTLTSSVGVNGYYYVVSVSGSTNLNGITDWVVGDWAIFNGTIWQKIDQTNLVTSVNGYTGAVVLGASDVGALSSATSSDGSIVVSQVGTIVDLTVSNTSPASVLVEQVRNTTGATLTKGTAVYISGATGQIPTVSKALATSDATSAQTLGLITADIANNANGFVTIVGLVTNLNTSAYTDGAQLYLSPTTAGTLTATKPYAPQHLVYMAIVAHAHPTQGKLIVKVQNGYELDELHNVSAQSPTTGQTIVWNSSTSLWEKNTVSLTVGVNGSLPIANGGTGQTTATTAFNALAPSQATNSGKFLTTDGTNTSWATTATAVTLSNDTSTATDLYPLFASTTSGTASTIYTGNAKLLYKPSTGEFSSSVVNATNGIVVNSQTVAVSYTIAVGSSGMSSGPVTIASGQSVTVSSGSRWVVV